MSSLSWQEIIERGTRRLQFRSAEGLFAILCALGADEQAQTLDEVRELLDGEPNEKTLTKTLGELADLGAVQIVRAQGRGGTKTYRLTVWGRQVMLGDAPATPWGKVLED